MRKLKYTSNKNLTWNVYVYNFNKRCIETRNILGKESVIIRDILEKAKSEYKENVPDYDKFKEEVRNVVMYYYWAKCEWEVIISAWPPNENAKEEKVDVYSQVMLNFDQFYRYLYYGLFGDCEQCEEN